MSKPITDSKGRVVVDLEWECVGEYDEGAYLVSASYADGTCEEDSYVPEVELEWIAGQYADLGCKYAEESWMARAEFAWDMARGH